MTMILETWHFVLAGVLLATLAFISFGVYQDVAAKVKQWRKKK